MTVYEVCLLRKKGGVCLRIYLMGVHIVPVDALHKLMTAPRESTTGEERVAGFRVKREVLRNGRSFERDMFDGTTRRLNNGDAIVIVREDHLAIAAGTPAVADDTNMAMAVLDAKNTLRRESPVVVDVASVQVNDEDAVIEPLKFQRSRGDLYVSLFRELERQGVPAEVAERCADLRLPR